MGAASTVARKAWMLGKPVTKYSEWLNSQGLLRAHSSQAPSLRHHLVTLHRKRPARRIKNRDIPSRRTVALTSRIQASSGHKEPLVLHPHAAPAAQLHRYAGRRWVQQRSSCRLKAPHTLELSPHKRVKSHGVCILRGLGASFVPRNNRLLARLRTDWSWNAASFC